MNIDSSRFNSSAFERLGISVKSASIPQETVDYFRKQQEADAEKGKAAPLALQAEAESQRSSWPISSANAAFLAHLLADDGSTR